MKNSWISNGVPRNISTYGEKIHPIHPGRERAIPTMVPITKAIKKEITVIFSVMPAPVISSRWFFMMRLN
jgi:hypothetical protein